MNSTSLTDQSTTQASVSMTNKIEFSPAIPLRTPFDVQKRIQDLHEYLNPESPQCQPEQQHVNIKATIQFYKDKKIDGSQRVYIMDGELVSREEMFKGSTWAWGEVCL